MKLAEEIYSKGTRFTSSFFRISYLPCAEEDKGKLIVSVPKRSFKRAVKRNLIRRRIKEAFRLSISDFPNVQGKNIMIVYMSKEIALYEDIRTHLCEALAKIS